MYHAFEFFFVRNKRELSRRRSPVDCGARSGPFGRGARLAPRPPVPSLKTTREELFVVICLAYVENFCACGKAG